eukprot:3650905-Prymnesium_polylepis.1
MRWARRSRTATHPPRLSALAGMLAGSQPNRPNLCPTHTIEPGIDRAKRATAASRDGWRVEQTEAGRRARRGGPG